jgi:hypothetical protein
LNAITLHDVSRREAGRLADLVTEDAARHFKLSQNRHATAAEKNEFGRDAELLAALAEAIGGAYQV